MSNWLDWWPLGVPTPPEESLVGRDDLVRSLSVNRTERWLRHWEHLGLIPSPVRKWHDGAVRALYPPFAPLFVDMVYARAKQHKEPVAVIGYAHLLFEWLAMNGDQFMATRSALRDMERDLERSVFERLPALLAGR